MYLMPKKVRHPTCYGTTAKLKKFQLNIIVVLYGHPFLEEQHAIEFLNLCRCY